MNAWETLEAIQSAEQNEYLLAAYLHFTYHDSAKLEDFVSLSTSSRANEFCMRCSEIVGSVCAHCYATHLFDYRKNDQCFVNNALILTQHLLPMEALSGIFLKFRPYLRIESMGEVYNVIHARNYIRLAKAQAEKGVKTVIWSKRPDIYAEAFKLEGGKPDCIKFVMSSIMLNEPDLESLEKYPFIDKLFTVYQRDYAKKHKIEINCAKKCNSCMKCYLDNGIVFINELAR